MADEVQVAITGLDDVLAKMSTLPDNIQTRILNAAMRNAAAVIQVDAQSRAPVLKVPNQNRVTGLVKANVAVRKMTKKRVTQLGGSTGYSVGVLGGAAPKEPPTRKNKRKGINGEAVNAKARPFYWRYLEFGTEHQKAQPFLRPAFDAKKLAAIDAVRVYMTANLYKALQT